MFLIILTRAHTWHIHICIFLVCVWRNFVNANDRVNESILLKLNFCPIDRQFIIRRPYDKRVNQFFVMLNVSCAFLFFFCLFQCGDSPCDEVPKEKVTRVSIYIFIMIFFFFSLIVHSYPFHGRQWKSCFDYSPNDESSLTIQNDVDLYVTKKHTQYTNIFKILFYT